MKNLTFSLLLASCSHLAFAQQELLYPKVQEKQGMVQSPQPYYQVNGQQIAQPSLALLSPEAIESVEVLKSENATSRFGEKAKDGAVLIHTKPTAKLASLQDIYTHFRIPAAQQNLKVIINNQLVKDKALILADLSEIARVEVVKQEVTAPVRWSLNEEEEFLHITSKPRPKK